MKIKCDMCKETELDTYWDDPIILGAKKIYVCRRCLGRAEIDVTDTAFMTFNKWRRSKEV